VRAALSEVTISPPRFPVVTNVNAERNQDAAKVMDLLVRQVDSAVLWDRSVVCMAERGVDKALELGPGKVLAGLVKRIDKSLSVRSVGEPQDMEGIAEFLA
jgi:[acyl-carrier-protein] S-malonyltransferase